MQRRSSHSTQERISEVEDLLTNDKDNQPQYAKWKISAEDCDILIKMMLEKQTTMYYPTVLKEMNNQINHETAE